MIIEIPTKGTCLKHDSIREPTLEQLREWIGCEYIEVVTVFFKDEYEQLIVDTEGLLTNKPTNPYATEIYLENTRIHHKDLYLKAIFTNASIVGTAVLLTEENRLT